MMKWTDPRNCKNCEVEFVPADRHCGKSKFCTYSCRERYYHRKTNEKRAAARAMVAAAKADTPAV